MDKLLERISSYNLLNNLLPGSIFCYALRYFIGVDLLRGNTIDNLFLYYFAGMAVSRIGSIIIEPLCKKVRWITCIDYDKFVISSKLDDKINILLETNNTYRTFLSLFFMIALAKIYYIVGKEHFVLIKAIPIIMIVGLIILFALSYKKQTKYIIKRAETIISRNSQIDRGI